MRLIHREVVASDQRRVTLLLGCILLLFPSISNLHINIHQHFVELVSNNSYHYVDVCISCVYAGVDGLDLVLKSRQH